MQSTEDRPVRRSTTGSAREAVSVAPGRTPGALGEAGTGG